MQDAARRSRSHAGREWFKASDHCSDLAWRTRPERADEYEAYNYEVGIKPLIETALGVQTFREDREGETEFVTISYWESIEAMAAFAGPDPIRVHHLERDAEFLIELPKSVQILRLLTSHGVTGSGS
jgi:heme-degrading monooxygenase HmoA